MAAAVAGTGLAGTGHVSAQESLEHPLPVKFLLSRAVPIWVTRLSSLDPHPTAPAQCLSPLPGGLQPIWTPHPSPSQSLQPGHCACASPGLRPRWCGHAAGCSCCCPEQRRLQPGRCHTGAARAWLEALLVPENGELQCNSLPFNFTQFLLLNPLRNANLYNSRLKINVSPAAPSSGYLLPPAPAKALRGDPGAESTLLLASRAAAPCPVVPRLCQHMGALWDSEGSAACRSATTRSLITVGLGAWWQRDTGCLSSTAAGDALGVSAICLSSGEA